MVRDTVAVETLARLAMCLMSMNRQRKRILTESYHVSAVSLGRPQGCKASLQLESIKHNQTDLPLRMIKIGRLAIETRAARPTRHCGLISKRDHGIASTKIRTI